DIVIISHSRAGLQSHLDDFAIWCRANFLELSAKKSSVMEKYVGVTFTSTLRNIFGDHYKNKAEVAQACAHGGLFGLEHHVGRGNIPIRTSVQLYTALVDCHLIHGADVCPDVDDAALRLLERVQLSTLRRILGLGSRSSKVVLFTELGLYPLRCRRLLLCLSYLKYLLQLPETHFAHQALLVSEDLHTRSRHSNQLSALSRRYPLTFPVRSIKRAQHAALDTKVEQSISLYLLHSRLEPQNDGPAKHITSCIRHYLTGVTIADHRFAMTRILLGAHNLHGVHSDNSQASIQLQQCRMCHNHLETPEHMLLQCNADSDTTRIRDEFFSHLSQKTHPRFVPVSFTDNAALFWLKAVMFEWDAAPIVARWIYHTCRKWKALSLLPSEVHADIRHQHDDGDDG
ncbi:hypothetical protein BDZ89DRAFT_1084405, partial [Hymenopellis radicata]